MSQQWVIQIDSGYYGRDGEFTKSYRKALKSGIQRMKLIEKDLRESGITQIKLVKHRPKYRT